MLSFPGMETTAQLTPLDRAKKNCGGPSGLAEALLKQRCVQITPQAISLWDKVPAKRVLDVEAVSSVSRYELRPDLYGEPPVTESPSIVPDPFQSETERASS